VRKSLNLLGDLHVGQTAGGSIEPSVARPTTCGVEPAFKAIRKFRVKNAALKSGQLIGRYGQILEGF
jgi:hypothetical protein